MSQATQAQAALEGIRPTITILDRLVEMGVLKTWTTGYEDGIWFKLTTFDNRIVELDVAQAIGFAYAFALMTSWGLQAYEEILVEGNLP